MRDEKPIKVAIVGGGCAGISAAFELTRPEHQGRYLVTVYQLGWRLGGKGASGRGPAHRIQEHGLHMWMGFYENAFRLLRECYEELGRDPATCRFARWQDAFIADPLIGLAEQSSGGDWQVWKARLPAFEGLPGEAGHVLPRWTVGDYLARSLQLVRTLLGTLPVTQAEVARAPVSPAAGDAWTAESLRESIARLLRYGQLATLAAALEALRLLEVALQRPARDSEDMLLRLHEMICSALRNQLERQVAADEESRRLWEIVDLVLAAVRGVLRFRLLADERGFDAINDYDCREWLRLNGAGERSLNGAFIRALYDMAFAYERGDVNRPRVAAGQALRGTLRAFFTYRGAFFWKMRAGMGDVVFAPFYEVLTRRGCRFEFFHRLERVRLAGAAVLARGERPHVESLEFDVQAEVVGGGAYQPLVEVRGLRCWPAEPDWRQLVEGDRLRREGWRFESHWDRRKARSRTLRVGEDFDLVVLAVGGGAVRHVCQELVEQDPRWRAMVEHLATVPTQAFQLWLDASLQELGWEDVPMALSGFVEPFDTCVDMSHLVGEEGWPTPPQSIAYFCSVLPDVPDAEQLAPGYPEAQHERVRRNAVRFLQGDVAHLWPRAHQAPGAFRWDRIVTPPGADANLQGEERFATQYWTANVNPSDRYTLCLPGSPRFRISPLDNTYDNFTIAGDWTGCGFTEGCVEAAVMSGRLAAHALSGLPRLEEIVGFDHP